jgi:hypothetical protein
MRPTVAVEELTATDFGCELSVAGLLVVWGEPGIVRAALLSSGTSSDEVLSRDLDVLRGAALLEVQNVDQTRRALERFTACLICGGPIGVCSPAVLRGRLERREGLPIITVMSGTVAERGVRLWDFTVDSTE